MQGSRPEIDLLLSCARTCPDLAAKDRARKLLANETDWAYLLRLAELHGLAPLLYHNLKGMSSELVPSPVRDRLHDQFLANAGRNLLLTEELVQILNLLEANDILAIPFKGPVLAASLYGNLALRTFSDLDILVKKQDVAKAKDLLLSSGFQWQSQLTPSQKATYLQDDYGCLFFQDKSGRVFVELDRGLSLREFPVSFNLEHLTGRLTRVSLEGNRVPAFLPEDLLLILCLHGAKHRWTRLKWVCDLGELIRVHPELDWGGVMEQAATRGGMRMLLLGLFLAHHLLEAVLPAEILSKINANLVVQTLGKSIVQGLVSDRESPTGTKALSLFYLRLSENLKDRVAYCLRLGFTPTVDDWQTFPLPSSLSFLYYFTHPLRLLGKYGFGLMGHP